MSKRSVYMAVFVFHSSHTTFTEARCVKILVKTLEHCGMNFALEGADVPSFYFNDLQHTDLGGKVIGYTYIEGPRANTVKLCVYFEGMSLDVCGALEHVLDDITYVYSVQLLTPYDDKPVWESRCYPDGDYDQYFARLTTWDAWDMSRAVAPGECEDYSIRSTWRDGWSLEKLLRDSDVYSSPGDMKSLVMPH